MNIQALPVKKWEIILASLHFLYFAGCLIVLFSGYGGNLLFPGSILLIPASAVLFYRNPKFALFTSAVLLPPGVYFEDFIAIEEVSLPGFSLMMGSVIGTCASLLKKRPLSRQAVVALIILGIYFTIAGITTGFGSTSIIGLLSIGFMGLYALGILLPSLLLSRKAILQVILAYTISLIFTTLFLYIRTHPSVLNGMKPFFRDHLTLGLNLSICAAFVLSMLIQALKDRKPKLALLSGSLLIALTFLSFYGFCRFTWLGLTISALLVPAFFLRKWWAKLCYLGTISILVIVSTMFLRSSLEQEQSTPRLKRLRQLVYVEDDFSAEERIMRWELATRMIREKPITGHGQNYYSLNFASYLKGDEEKNKISYWFGFKDSAHNEFLRILAENGLLGLAAFLSFLIYITSIIAKPGRSTIYGTLLLTNILIFFLFNDAMIYAKAASVCWLAFALIIARPNGEKLLS